MMRPDAKVEKVYLYPKPVDFRKSIDGLAALVELDIKVAVFDPVLFVFLNKPRNRVKILYWERNGFSGTELATRRLRPLAQPSASGIDASIRRLIRYNPRHDFHARRPP